MVGKPQYEGSLLQRIGKCTFEPVWDLVLTCSQGNVRPRRVEYVRHILTLPDVPHSSTRSKSSHFEADLVFTLSHALGDDLVGNTSRPEAVAKLTNLVKRRLEIRRLNPEIRTFLESGDGAAWRE